MRRHGLTLWRKARRQLVACFGALVATTSVAVTSAAAQSAGTSPDPVAEEASRIRESWSAMREAASAVRERASRIREEASKIREEASRIRERMGEDARDRQRAGACQPSPTSPRGVDVHRYLTRAGTYGFSGIVLVALENEAILACGYGTVPDGGTALSWSTPFPIASLAKQFTAAAILRLESNGLLSVDDLLARYLPGVPEDKAGITLHQLLTHASGLADPLEDEREYTREEAVAAILQSDLVFEPGTDVQYSNSGYTLLAALVESLAGQPFHEFLRTEFFVPLGMGQTGPARSDFPAEAAREPEARWSVAGAGGMASTVDDLHRWMRALGSGSVLTASGTEKMFTAHGGTYGYGWRVADSRAFGRVVWHNGDTGDLNSSIRRYADRALTVIYFDPSRLRGSVLNKVILLGLGEAIDMPPAGDAVTPASIPSGMLGTYVLTGGDEIEVWADDGAVWIGARGQVAVNALESLDSAAADTALALSRKTDEIVRAIAHGRLEPVVAAFNPRIAPDIIRGAVRDEWGAFERAHGPYTAHAMLGSVPSERGTWYAFARLEFSGGSDLYRFEWNDGRIDGIRSGESLERGPGSLPATRRYLRAPNGEYVTFDLRSGQAGHVSFEQDLDGAPGSFPLVIGDAAGGIVARKAPDRPRAPPNR